MVRQHPLLSGFLLTVLPFARQPAHCFPDTCCTLIPPRPCSSPEALTPSVYPNPAPSLRVFLNGTSPLSLSLTTSARNNSTQLPESPVFKSITWHLPYGASVITMCVCSSPSTRGCDFFEGKDCVFCTRYFPKCSLWYCKYRSPPANTHWKIVYWEKSAFWLGPHPPGLAKAHKEMRQEGLMAIKHTHTQRGMNTHRCIRPVYTEGGS